MPFSHLLDFYRKTFLGNDNIVDIHYRERILYTLYEKIFQFIHISYTFIIIKTN